MPASSAQLLQQVVVAEVTQPPGGPVSPTPASAPAAPRRSPAARPLGREERLEDARPGRLVHAAARVADRKEDVAARPDLGAEPGVAVVQYRPAARHWRPVATS